MFRKANIRNFVIIAVVLSLSFAAVQSAKAGYATPSYNDGSGRPAVNIPLTGCASAVVARLIGSETLWSLLFKVIKPDNGDTTTVFIPGPQPISVATACR